MSRALLIVSLVLAASACTAGSATGPRSGAMALHYDSLATDAALSGDTTRERYLSEMAIALARGVRPEPVVIAVNGITRRFEAVAYEGVVGHDSSFVIVAWDGWNPSAFVLAQVSTHGPVAATVTYAPGPTLMQSDSGTVTVTRLAVGGECPYTALHADPFGSATRCARQSSSWSFGVRLRPAVMGGAVRLDMVDHVIPGVRLDIAPTPSGSHALTQVAER
jgi:hypothetical protein